MPAAMRVRSGQVQSSALHLAEANYLSPELLPAKQEAAPEADQTLHVVTSVSRRSPVPELYCYEEVFDFKQDFNVEHSTFPDQKESDQLKMLKYISDASGLISFI